MDLVVNASPLNDMRAKCLWISESVLHAILQQAGE